VIGNALQYPALPCVFAMTNTIAGERGQRTLGMVLVTPAKRLPLFLGRALPVIANGFVVSAFALAAGSLLLDVELAEGAVAPLAVVIAAAAFSCTGLGLISGAIGFRVRETAVLSNVVFGFLLIFYGVNVPLDELPGWMSTIAQGLPLTHGIEAARRVADGESLGAVGGLVGAELLVGAVYISVGLVFLRFFEVQGRRHATLERA
jgi:ABC-2 type transport system permease protein